MPNLVTVRSHNEFVSIRPVKKHSRVHYMGACLLRNVVVGDDFLTAELLDEFNEARELSADVLKHLRQITFTDTGWFYNDDLEVWDKAVYEATKDGTDLNEIEVPEELAGKEFKAGYVCGTDFYVSK